MVFSKETKLVQHFAVSGMFGNGFVYIELIKEQIGV